MTLGQKQRKFTLDVARLIAFAYDNGFELSMGEAQRTRSQALLYYFGFKVEKGGPLGITLVKSRKLSRTLRSKHLSKLAIDFNFFIDGRLTYDYGETKILGKFWCSLDPKNRWGGDFNKNGKKDGFIDTPHFQRDL